MFYTVKELILALDHFLDIYPDLDVLKVDTIDGTRHGILVTFIGDNRKIMMRLPEGGNNDI